MLFATMLAMILHVYHIDELYTRTRMCDIDQPCCRSGNSLISPDIRQKAWNDRSFFLVGRRRFDKIENDGLELASLESIDCSRMHVLVPSPFRYGSTNFAGLGSIWCNNANTGMIG